MRRQEWWRQAPPSDAFPPSSCFIPLCASAPICCCFPFPPACSPRPCAPAAASVLRGSRWESTQDACARSLSLAQLADMVGPIPRASTFPLLLGGGSPRSSSQLPSWRRAPSGADGGSCLWGRGSRALLIAVVCLYSLVLLGLPALYSSFGSRPGSSGGITAAGSPGIGASSDLPAAALAEGVLQPPQLARALSAGRRSALEGGSGSIAAQLWPGAGRLHYGNTQTAQLPRVEYRDAGNVVALSDALNMSAWQEQELYRAGGWVLAARGRPAGTCIQQAASLHLHDKCPTLPWPAPPADPAPLAQLSAGASRNSSRGGSGGGSSAVGQRFPALCPQGPEVRVFIGVTSRCCTAEASTEGRAVAWPRSRAAVECDMPAPLLLSARHHQHCSHHCRPPAGAGQARRDPAHLDAGGQGPRVPRCHHPLHPGTAIHPGRPAHRHGAASGRGAAACRHHHRAG